MSQRATSAGLRITKVGFGFVTFGLVLLVAATNTGNNGLYLVLAVMAGLLVVAQILCAWNVRGVALSLGEPGEVFANRPARFGLTIKNNSRFFRRRLLLIVLERRVRGRRRGRSRRTRPFLVGSLAPGAEAVGDVEMIVRRRGWWRHGTLEVSSLFPVGFFHKTMRHATRFEVLVYPEIYPPPVALPRLRGGVGDDASARRGWGFELAGLRPFRPGDDPRAIHWKQTARTGSFVFKESAMEENRRLAIVFDNAAGILDDEAERVRFERLVSEAATAALDALGRGWEVELVTREAALPFSAGPKQRHAVLRALALVEPVAESAVPLVASRADVQQLRLAMEGPAEEPLGATG